MKSYTHSRSVACASYAIAAALLVAMLAIFCPRAYADEAVESHNIWANDYSRWSSVVESNLTTASSGNLQRVEYVSGTGLVVEEYANDYTIVSSRVIAASTYTPSEMADGASFRWGGFFAGETYNFVVTGQKNSSQSATCPVVRVTKYTKSWNYISCCEFRDINTTIPFDAGSLRMTELDGTLWIRTSHQMNKSLTDGLYHQANMTFAIDETSMTCSKSLTGVGSVSNALGYVSHSFNQLITTLDGAVYAVDHGDAYPRSVVMKKLGYSDAYTSIYPFVGMTGDNDTYASVGGLASSETEKTLLTVGSAADQSLVDTSDSPSSLMRNAWLTVTSADLSSTKTITLTSLDPDGDTRATNPIIVKVNENKFMVAWGIAQDTRYGASTSTEVNYVFVDGQGNYLSSVRSAIGVLSDCQPIVKDGKVVWYVTGDNVSNARHASTPVFCSVDTTTYAYACSGDMLFSRMTLVDSATRYYTGTAYEPDVTVVYGGAELVRGTDYDVEYRNNVDAGTATVVVSGKGDHSGTNVLSFTIHAARMTSATATIDATTYLRTGAAIEPVPTVVFNDKTLVRDVGYTVSYSDNIDVGTGRVSITGMGNFTGTLTKSFSIVDLVDMEDSSVTCYVMGASYTYTGENIEPPVVVRHNGYSLKSGTDYSVSYTDNVQAGTGHAIISGTGFYTGTRVVEFRIIQASLWTSSVSVDAVPDQVYTGTALEPGVVVRFGDTVLKAGTDYTVTYASNVKAGTASVALAGSGNFTGTRTVYFSVVPASLASSNVSIDAVPDQTYTGSAVRPTLTVHFGEMELQAGTDYTVTYANNESVGTATATITGRGNYTDTRTVQFAIVAATPDPDPIPDPDPDPEPSPDPDNPDPDPAPDPDPDNSDPTPDPDDPGSEAVLERIAGTDYAYQTSAKISEETFPDGSDWVVLARDDDFADAMSATGLAGTLEAPIVLTDRFGLSSEAADEIKRLGATSCYIIGGKGAMPGGFESQLEALNVTTVERVYGSESWDTSVACADKIAEHGGNWAEDAIVAMSTNFQDALSISSFAYTYGVPIFLETSGAGGSARALPDEAVVAISKLDGTIYVPGGTGAVPAVSVEGVFGADRVVRMYGADGYDTSNQIATYMVQNGLLSADTVCIACGAESAHGSDALSGAALAGMRGGVMLLTNANGALGDVRICTVEGADSRGTQAFLAANASSVSQAYVLGGTVVVPKTLYDTIAQMIS